jgi:hypothetical protein
MPGKPIEEHLLKTIEDTGGWEAIWDRVAQGESQASIAASFKRPDNGQGLSRGFFSRVMNLDPARATAFWNAKKLAATEYAEEAKDLVDNVPVDRDAISKAREQANHRRWLAMACDRDRYGEKGPDINVTVNNVAELHLSALRHRMVEASRSLAALPPSDPEPLQFPKPWTPAEHENGEEP